MAAAFEGRSLRHLLSPVYRKLETVVHPLRYLFVEITQRCNLKCRHCGSDCGRDARPDELSTQEWLDFFTFLGDRIDTKRVVLVITGGEPLCHPELGRILGGLKQSGLAFGMVSNGFALSKANVKKLVAAGIRSITVSLDGLRDSHDWLRGVNGSFEHALSGIENIVAAKLPLFDVVTCVNPRNLSELPRLSNLLRDLGVPAWRLFSIFPKGRAKQNAEVLLSPEDFRVMLDVISKERAEQKGSRFSVQFSCEGYLAAALDRRVRDEPYFCRAGIDIGGILCDGSITACPNISRTLVQGNIRKDDFATVWEKRFVPFRDRNWMKKGRCIGCREWKRCLGNSLHLWDDEAGQTARCTFDLAKSHSSGSPIQ